MTTATKTALSSEQMGDLIDSYLAACDEGDEDAAHSIACKIPMDPYLAKLICDLHGAEYVREAGFNLDAANEEFGDGWMDGQG